MKFLRSNEFFVKWHLSFYFVDMARTFEGVSGSCFYEPALWTNKYRFIKNELFQNGCNKVVIELHVAQFWSEIILVISNQTPAISKSRVWFQTKLYSTQFNYHYESWTIGPDFEESARPTEHICFEDFETCRWLASRLKLIKERKVEGISRCP